MSCYETIEEVLAAAGAMFDGGSETSREEIATEWRDNGFNAAASVAKWVEAGCWGPSAAASLKAAGFRPGRDKLSYRPGHERDDMDAMCALCNGDTSLKKLSW